MVGAEEEQAELQHRTNRVEGEFEFRHHPEIATSAADGPEQIGVVRVRRVQDAAVSGDHFSANEVVRRQAGQAREPAEAAAERQSSDAGPTDEATGDRQPMRLGSGIELAPCRAPSALGAARVGIDTHHFHRSQVDHQPIVAERAAGIVVAAPANRHHEVLLPSEVQGGSDVSAARTAGDDSRPSRAGRVPDVDGFVVTRLAGLRDSAADIRAQLVDHARRDVRHIGLLGAGWATRFCEITFREHQPQSAARSESAFPSRYSGAWIVADGASPITDVHARVVEQRLIQPVRFGEVGLTTPGMRAWILRTTRPH